MSASLKVNLWSNDMLYAWLSWNQRQSDEAIINEDLQTENKGFRLHNKSPNYDSSNNYVEIKLQMTWFLPILCSIFSDCPGLSLFALNNTYQSISSNQVSVFLFLTKKSPRFLMTKSFLSFHADKYFTQKNIVVKKNKFETINNNVTQSYK